MANAPSATLEKAGMGYDVMEAEGVISPVLEAHAVYRSMTRYGERVKIRMRIKAYNGIKLSIAYEVTSFCPVSRSAPGTVPGLNFRSSISGR